VESDIGQMVKYGLADDYWDSYVEELRKIDLAQVNAAAKSYVTPNKMIWLVIGDRALIEEKVRALNFGEVRVIDPEGNPVE